MVTIEGKKYKVLEDLGFVHSRGCYAKIWIFAHPIVKKQSNYIGQ